MTQAEPLNWLKRYPDDCEITIWGFNLSNQLNPLDLVKIAEKVAQLDSIRQKLIFSQDAVAEKKTTVHIELSKIYSILKSELVHFLSLHFNSTGNLKGQQQRVRTIQSAPLTVHIGDAQQRVRAARREVLQVR